MKKPISATPSPISTEATKGAPSASTTREGLIPHFLAIMNSVTGIRSIHRIVEATHSASTPKGVANKTRTVDSVCASDICASDFGWFVARSNAVDV